MNRGTGGTARLAGWRGWMARLLSAVVLLASLLVPPPAEGTTAPPPAAAASAVSDQDGGAGIPSRPDGIVHAGAHCACHVADRPDPPRYTAPTASGAVAHPIRTARALASREAEPPAPPPRT